MAKALLQKILKYLAKRIVRKYNPDIVGITGSVGKSSAKEAVAAILGTRFNVRKSLKNYNNEIGLPLTIIGAKETAGKSVTGWLAIIFRGFALAFFKDEKYPQY